MAVLRAGALLWSASAHRSLLLRSRRSPGRRALTCLGSASGLPHRSLTIIHFTDVYNIDARTIEPVGGAARFTSLVNGYAQDKPLVLFSGDCLNPSLLSAFTKGEQMVPILNGIGVRAAVAGNHGALACHSDKSNPASTLGRSTRVQLHCICNFALPCMIPSGN